MAGGYIGGVANLDRGSGYYTKEQADATFYKIGDNTGIIHSQRFIGASDKISYVLTRTPETKNNTQLFINGIYQNKEFYNITSNVLTLSEAPVDGYEIEVIIISSTLYADQDCSAQNLDYDPVGNGTTVLTIEDKLRSITGFIDYVKNDSLISNMFPVTGVHDSVLFVSGFWDQADGGGGLFFWDGRVPKYHHNGGTIIDPLKCEYLQAGDMQLEYFLPSQDGYGCWKRIYRGAPDIRWFGAKGNGSDDTISLQYAINHVSETLNISEGNYHVSTIVVDHNKQLVLDNSANITQRNNTNEVLFDISDVEFFSITGGTLNGNRANQSLPHSLIRSESALTTVSNVVIEHVSEYAISTKNHIKLDNVTVSDSKWGVSIIPDRVDYHDPIRISHCHFQTDQTAIEILESSDSLPRYTSVHISNNQINVLENTPAAYISFRNGLHFTGNHVVGGENVSFMAGDGGVISGNVFKRQETSLLLHNVTGVNISNNHLDGEGIGHTGIEHTSDTQTYNNIFNSNHIQNYTQAVARFEDDNNGLLFSNNTCHDSPLIISGSCNYVVSNNRFLDSTTGIQINGTTCATQSGNIIENSFSSNGIAIQLFSSPGRGINRLSIANNIFSNVGTCIYHNKNTGSIEMLSVIENTFTGYSELLLVPTPGDRPTSMLWKDNRGDTLHINSSNNLQHGRIIFGEKITLSDIPGLVIDVDTNSHAIGQQLKLFFTGNNHTVKVRVPSHKRTNAEFVFNHDFRYAVIEWNGTNWDDITEPYATQTHPGIIKVASFYECTVGTNDTNAVTPSGLKGLLNDNISINTHSWSSSKISTWVTDEITAAIDAIPYATTDVEGLIELATLGECEIGSDSTRAVTPVGLRGLIDDSIRITTKTWSSSKIGQYVDDNAGLTLEEEITSPQEHPLLFTNQQMCDSIRTAQIAPAFLYFVPETGTMCASNYSSLSDERYKENIEDITNPLSVLNQLRGVSFDWKETGNHSHGFIAQELELILPELVQTSSETGIKSISYTGLIGFIVEAIKILDKRTQ